MKNSIFSGFLLVFLLVAASCSSGDSAGSTSDLNGHKVSSISEKKYVGGILDSERTYVFTYENNILKNVVVGASRIDLTFSDDKIMTTKTYVSNVLQSTGTLTYAGNLLMSYTNVSATSVPQQKKRILLFR